MWDSIKDIVGRTAPLLGAALGGPAASIVGSMIAEALGVENAPNAVQKALETDPQAAIALQRLQNEHRREIQKMVLEAETTRLTEINKTIRAELETDDRYKSYWRPSFGYSVCLAWLAQAGAIVWAVVWQPEEAARIVEAVASLTAMWGVALAILGVNVSARSRDKQVAIGQEPTGLLDRLLARG